MKRSLKWVLVVLAVVLVAGALFRATSARRAQQAAAAAPPSETVLRLAASDVVRVAEEELARTLPVSGTLKAVDSAVIKARVAGELPGSPCAKATRCAVARSLRASTRRIPIARPPGAGAGRLRKAQIDCGPAHLRQQPGAGGAGLHFANRARHLAGDAECGPAPRTGRARRRRPRAQVARRHGAAQPHRRPGRTTSRATRRARRASTRASSRSSTSGRSNSKPPLARRGFGGGAGRPARVACDRGRRIGRAPARCS